jgi:hypothetical protein
MAGNRGIPMMLLYFKISLIFSALYILWVSIGARIA